MIALCLRGGRRVGVFFFSRGRVSRCYVVSGYDLFSGLSFLVIY